MSCIIFLLNFMPFLKSLLNNVGESPRQESFDKESPDFVTQIEFQMQLNSKILSDKNEINITFPLHASFNQSHGPPL